MSKEPIKCVICRTETFADLVKTEVLGDEKHRHRVVACNQCGHHQLNPSAYDLDFYEEDNQVKNVIKHYGTPFENLVRHSWIEGRRRVERFFKHGVLTDAEAAKQDFRVLDVGGGYGTFASKLLERFPNFDVTVMEPSKGRIETGREILKQSGTNSIPTFDAREVNEAFVAENAGEYDIVCLWHVLEHLEKPCEFMKLLSGLVKPGGTVCVEVPNLNDDLLKRSEGFKNRWYMVEHVSFFSPDLLALTARKEADFCSVEVFGYQRYGIFNYIHWIQTNAAQGAEPDILEGQGRWWLEQDWILTREAMQTSDALFMVCKV